MNIRNRTSDALFVAIRTNNVERLRLVLSNNDINLKDDRFDNYPLTMAANLKRWACVRLIAKHPADKKQKDLDHALFLAVRSNRINVVRVLLKAGANPNRNFKSNRNYEEWPSLFEALYNCNATIVGLLIYGGANLDSPAYFYENGFQRMQEIRTTCSVLEFVGKEKRETCLSAGWEEYEKLKAKDNLKQSEKDIVIVVAQGLRQRDSYIVKLPIELIEKILSLAENRFNDHVLSTYNQLNYISFNLVLNNYAPKLFSNNHSKQLVAKISDGITQKAVDFYALFRLVEKYLNKYLSEKKLTLDEAANKSSLVRLLKNYHIAESPEIGLEQKKLGFR